MVEAGRDVVVLMDSLTQLTRAYNIEVPHSGKILSAGLDAVALHKPKRLFGSARKVEEGGSLTVIATVLTDTDSHMNDVICEEFKGKANSVVLLDQQLAELHVYPPIDVGRTSTRREETLLETSELAAMRKLRRQLGTMPRQDALEHLLAGMASTADNAEFLRSV